jgi:hypothetical protein
MRRFLLSLCTCLAAITLHAQKDCGYQPYQQKALAEDPAMASRLQQIENFIQYKTEQRITVHGSTIPGVPEQINIPVVVHVLYNSADQNLPEARILAQIAALNKDFNASNDDISKVPAYFSEYVANSTGIRFTLAKIDPAGKATNGIVRKKTSIGMFGLDDRAKYSNAGGDNAWDASRYLNIWVCNTVGGLLGYSSLPGCLSEKDGIVINTTVFGNFAGGTVYNKGRTLTHEVGHWLGLRHIWGDASCGDDKVADTPPQRNANRGCPSGEKTTCGNAAHGDMYMNYMDLTDDGCMFMFTSGQRERMRSLFAAGGPRNVLLPSNALTGTPLPDEPGVPASFVKAINVYPNPASSVLQVSIAETDNHSNKNVVVYNHLGQVVTTQRLTGINTTINISQLQQGNYYLKITGSSHGMIKFMKL